MQNFFFFFNFYYHTRNPILRHYLVHPLPLFTLLLARYLIAKCRADAWFGYKEEILHITPNCGDSRATIITFKPKMERGEREGLREGFYEGGGYQLQYQTVLLLRAHIKCTKIYTRSIGRGDDATAH